MRRFVEIIQCDRCGHEENVEPNTLACGLTWTTITVPIPDGKEERHLCVDCRKQFDAWWRGEEG